MKVTIIGHWGAYPERGEATSGYLLQDDQSNILIDCGSGVLSLIQHTIALEDLDAVVLSHYHADHIADLYSLQYATMILTQLGKRKQPLIIYGHDQNADMYQSLTYKEYCLGQPIRTGEAQAIGSFMFQFVETIHPAYCLAMRIEHGEKSLFYTADTSWSDKLVTLAQGVDVLISEASLYDEQYSQATGHLTGQLAGVLAQKASVGQLFLTHLPHYGDHSELLQHARHTYTGPVRLAGKEIEIYLS